MREITVRAWDTHDNAWVYNIDEFAICDINFNVGKGRWIIEQYTGLKDKNGKEVYEGDVIEFEQWVDGKYYKKRGTVVYKIAGFICEAPEDIFDNRWPIYNQAMEVVGNIHE